MVIWVQSQGSKAGLSPRGHSDICWESTTFTYRARTHHVSSFYQGSTGFYLGPLPGSQYLCLPLHSEDAVLLPDLRCDPSPRFLQMPAPLSKVTANDSTLQQSWLFPSLWTHNRRWQRAGTCCWYEWGDGGLENSFLRHWLSCTSAPHTMRACCERYPQVQLSGNRASWGTRRSASLSAFLWARLSQLGLPANRHRPSSAVRSPPAGLVTVQVTHHVASASPFLTWRQ